MELGQRKEEVGVARYERALCSVPFGLNTRNMFLGIVYPVVRLCLVGLDTSWCG